MSVEITWTADEMKALELVLEEKEAAIRQLQADNARLRADRDNAIRETGDLREAVTKAAAMPWIPMPQPLGGTAYRCPDDKDIAAFVDSLRAEFDELKRVSQTVYELGMQTEREHQNALSRLVMEKHKAEVDALRAELEDARAWEDVPDGTYDCYESVELQRSGDMFYAAKGMKVVPFGLPRGWRIQRRAPSEGEVVDGE